MLNRVLCSFYALLHDRTIKRQKHISMFTGQISLRICETTRNPYGFNCFNHCLKWSDITIILWKLESLIAHNDEKLFWLWELDLPRRDMLTSVRLRKKAEQEAKLNFPATKNRCESVLWTSDEIWQACCRWNNHKGRDCNISLLSWSGLVSSL